MGKRVVQKNIKEEYKKEYRQLLKDEYITFNQSIKDSLKKRDEAKCSLEGYWQEYEISSFMPSWKDEDDNWQFWVRYGDMNSTVIECLRELSMRDSKIIMMRFGINHACEMTLEEVGACFGATRDRVREIEIKALRKLKKIIENKIPMQYFPCN